MEMVRSKVTAIVCAALLVGVAGGTLAFLSAARPAGSPQGSAAALANGATAPTATAAASSTSAGSDVTAPSTPTDTAVPAPTATRTPRPIPTLPPAGQSADLHGEIASVNSNSNTFVLNYGGLLVTCVVNQSTTWPGVPNFSSLRQGMDAEVQGKVQNATTLQATVVDAQVNN